jgi:hypothetical protein
VFESSACGSKGKSATKKGLPEETLKVLESRQQTSCGYPLGSWFSRCQLKAQFMVPEGRTVTVAWVAAEAELDVRQFRPLTELKDAL